MTLPEELQDINSQLNSSALNKFPDLSTSTVAEWKIWTGIMSIAIRALQIIAKDYKKHIDQRLAFVRPGTIGWYAEIVKSFQYGHNLIIKTDGSLGYAVEDANAKIIKAVAVSESDDEGVSVVVIKAARKVNEELVELLPEQRLALQNYITAVKFVGTKTTIVSTNADVLKYTIDVYYNPAYSASQIEASIVESFSNYRDSLGFNGVIYKQPFLQKILEVQGVITVGNYTLEVIPAGGVSEIIGIAYETQSGYFNFDDESAINLIPINNL
jgi:hypothetical protein